MAKNTIKLKKYLDVVVELIANAAITPGHLIERMTTDKVRVHAGSDQFIFPMFALEDELLGGNIDTAYTAATPVQCWIPTRGDVVNALLANGQTAVIGSMLSSNGDGTLKVFVPPTDSSAYAGVDYPNQVVGIAIEAVDMSGSSAVDPSGRIKVQIN